MIRIRKGSQLLIVPKTSFENFYKNDGWIQVVKKSDPLLDKLKNSSIYQLREMAKEKGIDTAGASKKTLISALLKA